MEEVVSEIIELVGEAHGPEGLGAGLIDEVPKLLPEGVIEGEILLADCFGCGGVDTAVVDVSFWEANGDVEIVVPISHQVGVLEIAFEVGVGDV